MEREKRKYAGVRKVRLLNATCCNLAQSGEFPSFDRGTRTCVLRGASTRVRARESILLLSLLPLLPLLLSSKDRGVALLWESERNLRSRRRYANRRANSHDFGDSWKIRPLELFRFDWPPTFELLTRRWPMFTANHDDTLSLSLSLSTDPLFFRRGDTWQASRSKRAHAHTTMFRFSFPSPPRPLNFTPVSNRMTRMRIDSTETIAFRIHSKKGWSVMGYNTWASVYLLT